MAKKKNIQNPIRKVISEKEINDTLQKWQDAWETAISLWSKFTKISPPLWGKTIEEDKELNLTDAFAQILLTDHTIRISIIQIIQNNLMDLPLEILCHEIGHHVYAPGDLTDQAKLLARIQIALPSKEHESAFVANLYTDLLINDRLKRDFNLNVEKIYQTINPQKMDNLWLFYMRTYEILWSLPRKTLAIGLVTDEIEGDAQLGNRVIRSYAKDWMKGGAKFAALCLPYLLENQSSDSCILMTLLGDMSKPGEGKCDLPSGLIQIDPDELNVQHPSLDEQDKDQDGANSNSNKKTELSAGQYREPFQFEQILKSLGLNISNHDMAVQYYREISIPHLVPFPTELQPEVSEPIAEGIDVWDVGSSITNINWFETALRSPIPIPGYTMVETYYGETIGEIESYEPVDLDIYVDSSGSMPNPQYNISYLSLAGVIIMLSALRSGSKVQATLWSGVREHLTTKGFIDNEMELIRIVTGFFGGATAFPIHILRDTYLKPKVLSNANKRKVHILHISDDGITTMFDKDEKKNNGWDISTEALKQAGGGGTMVLNLYQDWKKDKSLVRANKLGWDIYKISDWPELLKFAKEFSYKHYSKKNK